MSCSSCNLEVEDVGWGASTSNCKHLFCSQCIENKVKYCTRTSVVADEIGCSIQHPDDGSICRGYFTIKEIESFVDEEVFQEYLSSQRRLKDAGQIIDSEKNDDAEDDEDDDDEADDDDDDNEEDEEDDDWKSTVDEDESSARALRNKLEEDLFLSSEGDKSSSWAQVAQMIKEQMSAGASYSQAMEIIDKMPVWMTNQVISCIICSEEEVPARGGVILKDCLHAFCRVCLRNHIRYADSSAEVGCPFIEDDYKCDSVLKPRELKVLSSDEEYKKHYEDLSLKELESLPNVYNCRTPNCGYVCFVDQDANGASAVQFRCPRCQKSNCTRCKVIHEGGCQQYWQRIEDEEKERIRLMNELKEREEKEKRDRLNKLEQERLERLSEGEIQAGLRSGIYEKCPNCAYVCHKYTGCNHVVCASCKRQFNWGGGGK